jgi:hypothetical protein
MLFSFYQKEKEKLRVFHIMLLNATYGIILLLYDVVFVFPIHTTCKAWV